MSTKIQINSYDGITLKTKDKYCTDDLAISLKEELIPKGTKSITTNGEYDVTNYEKVSVNISPYGKLDITENGDYNISEYEYVSVAVTEPEDSFVKNNLPTIYRNDRIEEIGEFAFFNAKTLEEVYIPNVKKIGYGAFAGCNKLNKVVIEQDETVCTIDDYTTNAVFTYTSTGSNAVTNASIAYYADYGVLSFEITLEDWTGFRIFKNGTLLTKDNANFAGDMYNDSTEANLDGGLYWSPNNDNVEEKVGLLLSYHPNAPVTYKVTIDPDTTTIYLDLMEPLQYTLNDALGTRTGYAVANIKEECYEYEVSFMQWSHISFKLGGNALTQDTLTVSGDFYSENSAPWDNRLYFANDRTSLWCSKYAGGIYNFKYYYKKNELNIKYKDLSDIRANTFEDVYKLYGITHEEYNPNGDRTFFILVPANKLIEYKESWLNYASRIRGFADLYEGEQFPSYINDIYVLDNWYEDEQMTIKVDRSISLDVLESKMYYYNIAKQ